MKRWTKVELRWLEKHAHKFLNSELAARFNTTINSVKCCLMNHKIKPRRNRCFPKGHRPWNHRTKGLMNQTEASRKTQFQKGQLPHNTQQDGVITVRIDHSNRKARPYKWIRLSIGKWIHYHRYLWEQKYGSIPSTHLIRFKDGDTMNTTLENLEMITRGENARLNYNPVQAHKHSKGLSDNYVAGRLAGGNKKLRKAIILNMPELVKLKRTQLKLKRQIHERQNATRTTVG